MPRTKAVKKKTQRTLNPEHAKAIQEIEQMKQQHHENMERTFNVFLADLKTEMHLSKLTIPMVVLRKTLRELIDLPLNWSGNTTTASVLEMTKTQARKPRTRGSSAGEDEGYRTAESSNGTLGERKSRARGRTPKTTRTSRSTSTKESQGQTLKPPRTSRSASTRRTLAKFKTPAAQKIPLNTFGTITPKMKPNTPQVLLRRPKQGEVALSLQGSPLMTGGGTLISDDMANINIPLDGGRCISIQPQRGLRLSQIPPLDPQIQRQLAMLRDNISVCLASSR